MIIEKKSDKEIKIIKEAAEILSQIILKAKKSILKCNSTLDLENIICDTIKKYNCEPAFKGYRGYPACSCISIDDELVHGIPNKNKKIKRGQVVSIDIGIKYKNLYADAATTVFLDSQDIDIEKKQEIKNLLEVAYQSIYNVLPYIKDGVRTGDVGFHIQRFVESKGYNVIREYVGHAIGRELHEKPDIPNFGNPGEGLRILSNTVICVEPMVSIGDWHTVVDKDGWTVRMKDGKLCAHFEHMILVREQDSQILTDHEAIKPEII